MTTSGTDKLLLRVREAAEALGISRSHTYELVQSGKLPVVRLGASVRIPRAWLSQFVESETAAWERARGESLR